MNPLNTFGEVLRNFVVASTLALLTTAASAQAFPSQPLRWIVPYPAGGGSDVIARTVSASMKDALGQSIIVDNRPGAGTIIGTQALLASLPDGYTVSTADVGTLAYNPSLYTKLPYDVSKSFSYVGGLGRVGFVLVTRLGLPVNSVKEFLALAQREPGKLTFASAGPGSPHHVSMELLQQLGKIKLVHIPYKGGAPALQDLLAGQVDAMMLDVAGGLSSMKAGKVKLLGVATPARLAQLPDVPTMEEAGMPGFIAYSWQGLLAPADAPPVAVKRLSMDLRKALADQTVRRRLEEFGVEPMPMSPEEFAAHAKAELRRWAPVIKAADIKLD